jgi:hypothetical protein
MTEAMLDSEIRNRFNLLTWALGGVGALVIATLGMVFAMWQAIAGMSYQLGQINGQLAVLVNHVALK